MFEAVRQLADRKKLDNICVKDDYGVTVVWKGHICVMGGSQNCVEEYDGDKNAWHESKMKLWEPLQHFYAFQCRCACDLV